jgi:hypothetical protein
VSGVRWVASALPATTSAASIANPIATGWWLRPGLWVVDGVDGVAASPCLSLSYRANANSVRTV